MATAAVAGVVREDATDRQQLFSRAKTVDGAGHLPVRMRPSSGGVQEATADRLVPRLSAHLLHRKQAASYTNHERSGMTNYRIGPDSHHIDPQKGDRGMKLQFHCANIGRTISGTV